MNFHPLVVHFPIALLTLYVALEVFRMGPVRRWLDAKFYLVALGTLSALASLQTGSPAVHAVRALHPELRGAISIHSNLAGMTTAVFGLITALYLAAWLVRHDFARKLPLHGIITKIGFWSARFIDSGLVVIVALIGFVFLFVTGAIGGGIALGPSTDPITSYLFNLLVGQR